MKTLHLSPSLSLPFDAVTETFAILGKRGSGKTNTAVVFVEQLVAAKLPVCVIDPVGVWWGLRASADGKGAGLPITIIGGEHGDVPLEETAGKELAAFVVEEQAQVVLDLSNLRKNAQVRFMADFAETVFHLKAKRRDPLHLVIDEADAYAPQRASESGGLAPRLLGAMEDLIRRGRSRGIGMTVITQRPAVLNKNVLTQAEVLVVMKLTAPQDHKAIDEWVKQNDDEAKRAEVAKSLASLPVGTAWFWSPGWLNVFKKVQVSARTTFDSSATPKPGQRVVAPRELASVDLEALKKRIAATIEKSKTDDPKALRARITELEKQLSSRPKERVVEKVPFIPQHLLDAATTAMLRIEGARTLLMQAFEKAREEGARPDITSAARTVIGGPDLSVVPKHTNGIKHRDVNPPKVISTDAGDLKLRAGERKIVEVLARHFPVKLTRSQLATLAGYAAKGGTYGTYISVLRRAGFLDEAGDLVGVSDSGLALVGVKKKNPMTRDEVVEVWRNALRAGERSMLNIVVGLESVTRAELANAVDMEPTGGTFGTYLSVLRRNGLIDVSGQTVKLGKALAEAK